MSANPKNSTSLAFHATPSRFLDAVDDEHAERTADPGDPIHEFDVDVAAGIEVGVGVGGSVDEEEEAD
ncbi:MAG: hypothetical protein Q9201_007325 [Fulgogasparrea decipioides]